MSAGSRPGPFMMFFRAARLRCPRCGQGKLFRHYFSMVERCPRCDYAFAREEGFALGASVVNLVVCQLVAVAYLIVSIAMTLPDPPVTRLAILGVVIAIGSGLLFLPFSKTIWAAIDLIMYDTMGATYAQANQQPGLIPVEETVGPTVHAGAVGPPAADAGTGDGTPQSAPPES